MLKRKTPLKSKTKLKKKSNKLLDIIKGDDSAIIDKLKEKGLVRKASTLPAKRKPTGEKEVFRRIWDAADGNAKCLTCGVHIHEGKAINFSHLLPKGKYPEYRLDERNIVLQCGDCHSRWHNYGSEMRESKKWRGFFKRYDNLWDEVYPAHKA
jgi:hypothetical protein